MGSGGGGLFGSPSKLHKELLGVGGLERTGKGIFGRRATEKISKKFGKFDVARHITPGIFQTPKEISPPTPGELPKAIGRLDPRVLASRLRERRRARAAAGTASTIRTSPLGVQGTARTTRKSLLGF